MSVDIIVLFLILEEKLSAFHCVYGACSGLAMYNLYMLKYAHLVENFYYKWLLIFVKYFFSIY